MAVEDDKEETRPLVTTKTFSYPAHFCSLELAASQHREYKRLSGVACAMRCSVCILPTEGIHRGMVEQDLASHSLMCKEQVCGDQ